MRLGQLAIAVVPTELTTMAGRRLRKAVRARLVAAGVLDAEHGVVVAAGLANGYADYTTTYEEYQQQRYEGGSTIFGPHQLNGYIGEMLKLVDTMVANRHSTASSASSTRSTSPSSTSAAKPDDFSNKLINTGKRVSTDHMPSGAKQFGDQLSFSLVALEGGTSSALVQVQFAGANPLNDLKTNGTYAEVQRCTRETGSEGSTEGVVGACAEWLTVAVDGDWETRIRVIKKKKDLILETRVWEISWYVPVGTAGRYRVLHHGVSYDGPTIPIIQKGKFIPYTGTSEEFTL
jgi:neutral ceramidase